MHVYAYNDNSILISFLLLPLLFIVITFFFVFIFLAFIYLFFYLSSLNSSLFFLPTAIFFVSSSISPELYVFLKTPRTLPYLRTPLSTFTYTLLLAPFVFAVPRFFAINHWFLFVITELVISSRLITFFRNCCAIDLRKFLWDNMKHRNKKANE